MIHLGTRVRVLTGQKKQTFGRVGGYGYSLPEDFSQLFATRTRMYIVILDEPCGPIEAITASEDELWPLKAV